MFVSLLVVASMLAGPAPADFFPLVPGSSRTYETRGVSTHVNQDVVGDPVTVDGKPATPVTTYEFGQKISTIYYRVDDDGAYVVAFGSDKAGDPPRLLKAPIPVFKVGDGAFAFDGYAAPMEKDHIPDTVHLIGKTKMAGKRTVLGKSVDTIEVDTDVEIGSGPLSQKNHEVAIYAKGIGLVQMTSRISLARHDSKTEVRLTDYQEHKGAG
jgi:hypothetical protein